MYLYGASGHAKVIIDILETAGIEIQGLFDDNPKLKELCGIKVLGSYKGQQLDQPLIISIGNNTIRMKIAGNLNLTFGRAISSRAIVSRSARIGDGTVVMQGAIVQADAVIGEHCIINTGCSVDHDCRLGDFVHISPNATLCGNVQVGEGTHIGSGATIIPNVKIGCWATIGAGSVVIRDVPDHSTVVGVPAKQLNEKI